jgi:hypothetical protein
MSRANGQAPSENASQVPEGYVVKITGLKIEGGGGNVPRIRILIGGKASSRLSEDHGCIRSSSS